MGRLLFLSVSDAGESPEATWRVARRRAARGAGATLARLILVAALTAACGALGEPAPDLRADPARTGAWRPGTDGGGGGAM